MKKVMKKISTIMMFVAGLFIAQSCDVEPEFFSEISPENFFENEAQVVAFTSSGYEELGEYYTIAVLEGSVITDEMINPLRSNDGWGTNTDVMSHNFSPEEGSLGGAWNMAFPGVATCNRLIEFLEGLDTDNATSIAELRALRAFYLWVGLDFYGNIPVELKFFDANPAPSQVTPAEAFAIIESELLAVIPSLNEAKDASTYAKVNQATANMILAKLYINAKKYGVDAHWSEAAAAAQAVIATGNYTLESGYFSNFLINNEGSAENIWVVPYDKTNLNTNYNIIHQTMHQSASPTFGLAATPWGGFSVQEDFYNSFDNADNRKGMFIVGQQYSKEAGPIWDLSTGFQYSNPQPEFELDNCGEDYDLLDNDERTHFGLPTLADGDNADDLSAADRRTACNIVIDPNYNPVPTSISERTEDMVLYRGGARMAKYEHEVGTNLGVGSDNDLPIFRYAETLLIRAEALWRQNSGDAEAISLVNQIRSRAGLAPLGALTEDDLFTEFKHEMAMEGQGREILIRFGHWGDEWFFKSTDSDDPGDVYVPGSHKIWHPIPQDQIDANPNLVQTAGY